MQLNPKKYGTNVIGATKMIVKEEGVGFLTSGLAATVVGYGIEGSKLTAEVSTVIAVI